jgi:methylated-DNA-[protein]-cysteine S-methyltransferase
MNTVPTQTVPMNMQPTLDLDITVEHSPRAELRPRAPGPLRYALLDSPIGELLLTGDGESLAGIRMAPVGSPAPEWRHDPQAFAGAAEQLRAYFAAELRVFDLPLAPDGTDFQRRVWRELTTIPYGRTTSYGAIAAALGNPTGSRAVGLANGRNPIPIVIPCHRVIGSDGSLTGYGGGLPRKRHLLALEGAPHRA